MKTKTLAPLLVAVSAAFALMPYAGAGALSSKEVATGRVTACSWQNEDRCYTATLVKGKFGPKMRLKNGTVIDCEGDCRDTLRRATVDFWDDQRERSRD